MTPPAAIEVSGLGKSFGDHVALTDVSFSVGAGEVFGLLGPNGAGKTTTLRILAGLYAPDTGKARVAGREVTRTSGDDPELRRRIGLLTEQPGFYDRLSAVDNLVYFGRLYGLSPADARDRAGPLLERVGLGPHRSRSFATLSRGMKQKLAIARTLLHAPEVILLDEPTVGLDPEATREVRALIEDLASDGKTIVLCTHQLGEVERLCRRAAFLAGRLVGIHEVSEAMGRRFTLTLLEGTDPAAAAELAGPVPGVEQVRVDGQQLQLAVAEAPVVPEVVQALYVAGHRVLEVVPARLALEEAYLDLLSRARGEGLIQ